MSQLRPIQLRGIEMRGYQGVSPDKPLCLSHFGHRNIFIGQNDSGKSIPFRFLQIIIPVAKSPQKLWQRGTIGVVRSDSLWQQNRNTEVVVDFTFSSPCDAIENDFGRLALRDGKWRLRVNIRLIQNQGDATYELTPVVEYNGGLLPMVKFSNKNNEAVEYIHETGTYSESQSLITTSAVEILAKPFQDWLNGCRFFDPIRGINRPSKHANDLVEDGSTLLSEMSSLQKNAATQGDFDDWEASICQKLTRLLNPAFSTLRVLKEPPQIDLKKKTDGARFVPLLQMGTGVQQMIIAYSRLVRDENKQMTYFIEEPETNLHPRLLRGFIRDLADYSTIQFFITTHSSVLLDSLSDGDTVHHFEQDSHGACSANEATDIVSHHKILDALGVNGSTLLQSNCIIWVEGPSDRLYLRKWLQEYSDAKGNPVREGIDYSFLFYGGSILSHFQFEPTNDEIQELISLIRVCRYSAVIMDKNGHLTDSQVRLISEGAKDRNHRYASTTDGREIENDVSSRVFSLGVAKYLNCKQSALSNLQLDDNSRYMGQVAKLLADHPDEQKVIANKLSRKVSLAMTVLEVAAEEKATLGCPTYVPNLFDLIQTSKLAR